jgi:hypothetical protein
MLYIDLEKNFLSGVLMPSVTLNAHCNGQQIVLDEAFDLSENAKLLVTILETPNLERDEWQALAVQNPARANADGEPDLHFNSRVRSSRRV